MLLIGVLEGQNLLHKNENICTRTTDSWCMCDILKNVAKISLRELRYLIAANSNNFGYTSRILNFIDCSVHMLAVFPPVSPSPPHGVYGKNQRNIKSNVRLLYTSHRCMRSSRVVLALGRLTLLVRDLYLCCLSSGPHG